MYSCKILIDCGLGEKGEVIELSDSDTEIYVKERYIKILKYLGRKINVS